MGFRDETLWGLRNRLKLEVNKICDWEVKRIMLGHITKIGCRD